MPPSQVALCNSLWCHNSTTQLSNVTVHIFPKFFTFHGNICIFPLLLYSGILGLRWLCMHLWLKLINRTIDIQEKLRKSMYKVNGELFSRSITGSGRVLSREGGYTKLCMIIVLLNGFSKFAQNFTVGFLNLLSAHPIHIVVWWKLPL